MNYKEKITELNELRYKLIKSDDVQNDEQIDKYAEEILDFLKKGFDDLEFEFIFEQLTKLGQAPNLLYDDNGMFAVIYDGYQSVVIESPAERFETCFVVEDKNVWRESVREALRVYLFEEESEEE